MYLREQLVFWLASISIVSFVCASGAQDWQASSGLELTQEYSDNVFFTAEDKVDDLITRMQPKLQVARDTEVTQMRFGTKLNAEVYALHPDLSTVENDSQLQLTRSWSSRLSTGLNAFFSRNETLNQELEEAGLLAVRTERYRYGGGITGMYELSENTSVQAGTSLEETLYPDGTFPDQRLMRFNIHPNWKLNDRNTVGILADYSIVDYKDLALNRILAMSLTWRRALNERMYFEAGAGVDFSWLQQDITVPELVIGPGGIPQIVFRKIRQESTDNNYIFSFKLNKDWTQRFSSDISTGREQNNTVDAKSTERTYIRTSSTYKLSELSNVRIELGYDLNSTAGSGQEDAQYFRIAPAFSRRISERLSLSMGGSYEYVIDQGVAANTNRDRSTVWVSLTYDWPRMFSNH
ncbi:MAG: hypothetical protein AB9866_25370 [Syntrophobacteraceae bacterium]